MKLYISQEDIDSGQPSSTTKCGLARAFTRATGLECRAGHGSVWIPSLEVMGDVGQDASRFISMFDLDPRFCKPTVVELYFDYDAPEILQKDYLPPTDLRDMVTRKNIPGKPMSKAVYAH